MKKIIFTFLLVLLTTTSHSHMSDKEISESLKCAGIFTSTQFIKQGELPNGDLAYKENSLAAAKVTREFLTNEGVSEDKINSLLSDKEKLKQVVGDIIQNYANKRTAIIDSVSKRLNKYI